MKAKSEMMGIARRDGGADKREEGVADWRARAVAVGDEVELSG